MADEMIENDAAVEATEAKTAEGVDKARENLVKQWCEKVKKSKTHFAKPFKRMKDCQQIAFAGDDDTWTTGDDNYTVPILGRHINQAVAQLYAKSPKVSAKRRKKLYYSLWDGKQETAMAAIQAAQPKPLGVLDPTTGMPAIQPPDPQAIAMLQEIETARQQIAQDDKFGQTLELLWDYYTGEQAISFKMRLKRAVRRAKTNGVGYIKADFQRALEHRPDRDAEISDITSKIGDIDALIARGESGDMDSDAAEVENLRLQLKQLEAEEMVLVREGPVWGFPKSTQVIVDPECVDLRTFEGANWIAIEYDMSADRIDTVYGKDVRKEGTTYKEGGDIAPYKVWEIWDKRGRQVATICDGFNDFLKEPAAPFVKLDRFYTVFALVFNEIEHDDELYPPSDVWLARHPQHEYNASRQGLREHRKANRPYYAGAKGALEESDKTKLQNHEAFEFIELNVSATENFDVARIIQRGPNIPIDPNQYEVNGVFQDVLRTVGSQEANLGGTAGGTATESSIAESSRSTYTADNVDSLDELLSENAHAFSQIALMHLQPETVMEIVGPGAAWPEAQMTREQISKDLTLEIRAGSSGRPNRASELANMERGMPFIVQLPNINPEPIAKRYLDLLDIDLEEAIAEGMPSIMALNQMLTGANGNPGGAPTGDPASDPAAQGGAGAQNAPSAGRTAGGPQPAYPTGVPNGA